MGRFWLVILIIVFLPDCKTGDNKTPVSPQLKVSDNRRYLVTKDKEPFFWIGGTVWGICEWLTREEVDFYLDNRKEKGFNLIQVCLFWGKREDNPVSFTLNPPNAYGFKAFKETNGLPDPAKPAYTRKGSPKEPDDYWDHAEYVIQAAEKRKMAVALLPLWGRRYVNGTHTNFSHKIFSQTAMHSYGKFLGERFGDYSNIIWVMGGDVAADLGGDFSGHYRAMAEGIIAGITGKAVKWNEDSELWDFALMTYHPDGSPLKNSSKWFHNDRWLDFNMIETYTNRDMVYTAVTSDYLLDNPVKPTVMGEPGYEGYLPGTKADNSTDIQMRRQAFHSFFAGAAGFTYGAACDSLGNGPLFSPFKGWQLTLDMKGAESMKFVKKFCLDNQWPDWIPVYDIIKSKVGKSEFQTVSVITGRRNKCLLYFPDNNSEILGLSSHFKGIEKFILQWYNPVSGDYTDESVVVTKGRELTVDPPEGWNDALLILSPQSH